MPRVGISKREKEKKERMMMGEGLTTTTFVGKKNKIRERETEWTFLTCDLSIFMRIK